MSEEENDEDDEEESMASDDMSEPEDGFLEPGRRAQVRDALLGSKHDRRALAAVLRHFRKDDFASSEDNVVAAIRMQVHPMSKAQQKTTAFITCSLFSIVHKREDQGYCFLTEKGRVIYYGKGQEAQPDLVRRYLEKVMCSLTALICVAYLPVTILFHAHLTTLSLVLAAISFAIFIVLAGVYMYAQRPRSDCGAAYRQHFTVSRLCAGTYARVDSGRRWRQCCARRREGHLRLCFGRKYPDAEDFSYGLPVGAPDVGSVQLVSSFPAAKAAETAMARKDEMETEEAVIVRRHLGIGPRLTTFLAVLGIIGTSYDYLSFGKLVDEDNQVCEQKVPQCHWEVQNPSWLRKERWVMGTFPPSEPRHMGCDKHNEYCDVFYQPLNFCLPKDGFGLDQLVRLVCDDIKGLRGIMRKVPLAANKVAYVTKQSLEFLSQPTAERADRHMVMLKEGMRLVMIGSRESEWTQQLDADQHVDFRGTQKQCKEMYKGAVDFIFRAEPENIRLMEDDCHELQEACLARVAGPETFAFWPPDRIFNPKYLRTVCLYHARRTGRKVWHVLEGGRPGAEGLTCNGPRLERFFWREGENATLERCKKKCEQRQGCRNIFFSEPVPGGRRGEQALGRRCLLYAWCPRRRRPRPVDPDDFKRVECGGACQGDNITNCEAFVKPFRWIDHDRGYGREGCHAACRNYTKKRSLVDCNGYAYFYDGLLGKYVCHIYGPEGMPRPTKRWKELAQPVPLGAIGWQGLNQTECYRRRFPAPRNRKRAGFPGVLLEYTDKEGCHGCFAKSLFTFLLSPSNFASVLTDLLTICSFLFIARVAHEVVQAGKTVFTGRPIIDMFIKQDLANKDFDTKERAYTTFMTRCFEVARSLEVGDTSQEKRVPDVWDQEPRQTAEDVKVVPVSRKSFDEYELSNDLRTTCYVDKELLGFTPGEAVRAAWSDSNWLGFVRPVGYSILWLFVNVICPFQFSRYHCAVVVVVLVCGWGYYYAELRREVQGLCAVTSAGRLVQMSRRPPPVYWPSWRGGTSLRLDSVVVGKIYMAQMDMPASPLWEDRVRAYGQRPGWRRGVVTVRASRGLLAVERAQGEALTVFNGLQELASIRRTAGMGTVGAGGGELSGLCPARDLFHHDEKHVWEHTFTSFGFWTDSFNYASMLTITDCRVLVTRTRVPKRINLRGLLVGPMTCGRRCQLFQEAYGTNSYLSVSSLWNEGLESYATTRTRAPPFWPGFLAPVSSISVAFLGSYMRNYPAGFFVTQRPYGIPRKVHVTSEVRLVSRNGELRISLSKQLGAPLHHEVVEVVDPEGEEVALDDRRWLAPRGAPVEPGSMIKLEAADPEWKRYADEPWLWQLRSILDHILGRSVAPPDTWDDLDDSAPPPAPSACGRILAKVFGGEMLGQHAHVEDSGEEESDDEDEASNGNEERAPFIRTAH